MGKTLTAPRIISGTFGKLYWDGELIYEVTSFEAKLKLERESIRFAGTMSDDSKLVGISGTYSIKLKKAFSRAAELAKQIKKGIDPRLTFIGVLDDPDTYGAERVALYNCYLDELTLMAFEGKKLVEDDFSGGFSDFEYLDTIVA